MITLLHGDYIELSRNELNRLKREAAGKEIRSLDGKHLDDSELVQALESSSLFGGSTVVVIDQLFSKLGKKPKRVEALAEIVARGGVKTDIILWEDKELGATLVRQFGNGVNVKLFKMPVLIFQFLDSIRTGNSRALLGLFTLLEATEPPELVFSMMVKRIRQLVQLSDNVEPEGLAGWQIARLTTQAKSFTMEKLLTMYKQLHDIEVTVKTGASAFSLSSLIEQFLCEV